MADEQLTIRLPRQMRLYLENIARKQSRSLSSIVREALLTVMPDDIKAEMWGTDELKRN